MIQRPESASREGNRVRDLPDFTAPPLNEVILSIQFATLDNLKSAHIGILWERFRSDYPTVTEQAPIQTQFETFGIPSQAPALMQFQTLLSPPMPRYWFEHPGRPDLLQIQHDRILHNWRQQSGNSRVYPRYEPVKKVFEREIDIFERWLSDEKIGELRPNQCEVTYINFIGLPEGTTLNNCMDRITPMWRTKFSEVPPNELERVRVESAFLFSQGESPAGRVYANFVPAFLQSDRSPIIRLEITARGRPKGETIADALSFLDVEREQVVRTFAAITTPEMHKLWGRTNGKR
jgi:uncharacterized protein (TIGR04255 family)